MTNDVLFDYCLWRYGSLQFSRMLLIFSMWIVIIILTTAKHLEKPCASWWTLNRGKRFAMCNFHKDLMVLIVMIDTQTGMLYSLTYVHFSLFPPHPPLSFSLKQENYCYYREANFLMQTDQHERIGWYPRTNICRNWVCFQKASTIRLWCSCQEEASWQDLQLLAKVVLSVLWI